MKSPSRYYPLLLCLLVQVCSTPAKGPPEPAASLLSNLQYLASPELNGREVGTPGAKLAADYIASQMQKISLMPKGDAGSFLQGFGFHGPLRLAGDSHITSGGNRFVIGQDFLPYTDCSPAQAHGSAVKVGYGIRAPELKHDDYGGFEPEELTGKFFVITRGSPKGAVTKGPFAKHSLLKTKVKLALTFGAAGILFIPHPKTKGELPKWELDTGPLPPSREVAGIPCAFLTKKSAGKIKKAEVIEIATGWHRTKGRGYNVAGYIDNGAAYTVLIGAHFDHLGGSPLHPGADDNASGIGALLEIAKRLVAPANKRKQPTKTTSPAAGQSQTKANYLFVAFSGEETGLLGSRHFVSNPPIPLRQLNYMLNMDMVGRLGPKGLYALGASSSPGWPKLLRATRKKVASKFRLRFDPWGPGAGYSDQNPFYYAGVPALHFWTGSHPDYHRPSDTLDKLNYKGLDEVIDFIYTLIQQSRRYKKLKHYRNKKKESKGPLPSQVIH